MNATHVAWMSSVRRLLAPFVGLVLGAIAAPCSLAQSGDYRVAHLTTRDGLSQSIVYAMMQDSHGFLWFGTRDGLDRFDGYSIRTHRYDPFDTTTLSDYIVTAIAEDSSGHIWAGTLIGGLNRVDRRTGRSTRFRHEESNPHSLSGNGIRAVAVDSTGAVWVLTGAGIDRYDARRRRFDRMRSEDVGLRTRNDTLSLFVDRTGIVWHCWSDRPVGVPAAAITGGRCRLSRYDVPSRTLTTWDVPVDAGHMKVIGDDADGNIQIVPLSVTSARQPLMYRFDPRTQALRSYTVASQLLTPVWERQNLIPVMIDGGTCWYASAIGANLVGPSGRYKLFHEPLVPLIAAPREHVGRAPYVAPIPLTDCLPFPLMRDRAGTIWVAMEAEVASITPSGAGVHTWRHDHNDATTLSADRIRGVAIDGRGVLWVGTDDGLNRYEPATNSWRRFMASDAAPHGLPHSTVNAIYRDTDGRVLFGTNGGIATVDAAGRPVRLDLPGLRASRSPAVHVWSFLRDHNKRLWVGTDALGVFVLDSNGRLEHHFRHDPGDGASLSDGGVWSLHQDALGTVWIGTNEGLSRWFEGTGRFRRYVHEPGNRRSIGGKRIWALHEDLDGELWICSYGGGISRYRRRTDDFETVTARDGLGTNAVIGLLEDNHRNFWIATTRGLVRWNRGSNTFRHLDEHDGLQGYEFAFHAFARSTDGTMYFGGVDGLSAFRPEQLHADLNVPQLIISEFKVVDSIVAAELFDGDTVRLDYDQNYITLEFAALSFVNPGRNRYEYRLDGLNRAWTSAGSTERVATYSHLAPGTYTFRVRGSNASGTWNDPGAAITIILAPPWWGTWAFRVAAALMICIAVVIGNRARTNGIRTSEREKQEGLLRAALESQEVERQRIARDLHDGVGQLLAAAGLNLQSLRELSSTNGYEEIEPPSMRSPLERTISILNQAAGDVRALSHGLGTSTLRELGIVAAMGELLENLDGDGPTRFEFVALEMDRRFGTSVETGLFRIAQELIANVLHHAAATEATVQIVRDHDEIRLAVEDNGVGFDTATSCRGMGLENVRARVSAMHGRLHCDSAPGHGTTVTVALDMAHDLS